MIKAIKQRISYLRTKCDRLAKSIIHRPYYYRYAKNNIKCDCPVCGCPFQGRYLYSFVYVREDLKIIYYDIPKCASSTIRSGLFDGNQRYSMVNPQRKLDQYFTFSFVRNLWDRMVSNWKMFNTRSDRIEQLKTMRNGKWANKDLSVFENFVYFADEVKNHHWQPQVLFLPEKLDFLGKLESFDKDFNDMMDLVGGKKRKLEKRNVIARDPYWIYYTPALVDFVEKMYLQDVQQFGYAFEEKRVD